MPCGAIFHTHFMYPYRTQNVKESNQFSHYYTKTSNFLIVLCFPHVDAEERLKER